MGKGKGKNKREKAPKRATRINRLRARQRNAAKRIGELERKRAEIWEQVEGLKTQGRTREHPDVRGLLDRLENLGAKVHRVSSLSARRQMRIQQLSKGQGK